MILRAYIHEYGHHQLEPEHADIKEVLEARGVECVLFTSKVLQRNQLQLNDQTLVVGDHPTMQSVFKRMGVNVANDCYPKSLKKYLNRTILETIVRKLQIKNQHTEISNMFIKPKSKAKLFTGFVLHSSEDLFQLDRLAKDTELYCSTVVEWISEYRVFVNRSRIVGIKHYLGDEQVKLNMATVENALTDFENSDQRTDAYGMDFGVLKNGETAFIEWNDGFALGSYGLDKEVYTDLILARWEEIVGKLKEC